jgi:twinkle protein
MEQSKFIKHRLPCTACDSSDAVSVNEDGSAKCFSCNTWYVKYDQNIIGEKVENKVNNSNPLNAHGGVFAPLTDRSIKKETAQKYGVKVVYGSDGALAQHIYPYHINNEIVANKIRYIRDKKFSVTGSFTGTGLFGQNEFKEGGKYITLVEGEADAMAAYELLGEKWAVVSIKRGASSAVKDVKESIEYLESFDNIMICFDKDKAGEEASKQVASIIKPGKARIITLPNGYKDANDMLRQGKFQEFTRAWWDAKVYTPSGIIRVSEKEHDFFNREKLDSVPYPYEGLNKKLEGLRQRELLTVCGGTGLGKSSFTREIEHWLVEKTKDNVGVIALEESWQRTVDGILSIEADARLYVDSVRDQFDQETLRDMYRKVFGDDRVFVHAHFGTNDIDDIFSKLRYLIVGCDCKWVIVDHLHMLVSATSEGDERRAIDNIMTRLRSMVEETGAGIILVSHLRRISGDKGHENGVTVSLSHLRGSNSIAQLSDCVIALERNQQADDDLESRTTKLRILKSRYTGDVGLATSLIYDPVTGRMAEENYSDLLNDDDGVPF